MSRNRQNTVYLEEHQHVFFKLTRSYSKSGVAREAFDDWLEKNQEMSPTELKMAVTVVRERSDRSLYAVIEECADLEEFMERAEKLSEQTQQYND